MVLVVCVRVIVSMIPAFRRNGGFSLIELSIILMIASMLTVTVLYQYRDWRNSKIAGDTESRRNIVSNALTLFITNFGRLPAPADPTLSNSAPSAGYEAAPATYGGAVGECNGAVCRVAGFKDTPLDTNSTNDPVLIGAVPYAALGISPVDATDGWGNKFTYAVTEYLTNSSVNRGGAFAAGMAPIFNDQAGAIRMEETVAEQVSDLSAPSGFRYTGNVLAPNPSQNPDFAGSNKLNSFMLVVVSHGPDGKGAYTYGGVLNSPCSGVGRDLENCDGDADFIKADKGTGVYNRVPGTAYFDDAFTIYRIRRDSDKWTAVGTSSMQNKQGGNVGIGVSMPSTALDVGGNIKANNIWGSSYCSANGNCFTSSVIAGAIDDANPSVSAAHCGTTSMPKLMKGINGTATWKVDCVDALNTLGITAASCPPGQYMTGIDGSGNITCALP